jgi:hypothetical protein
MRGIIILGSPWLKGVWRKIFGLWDTVLDSGHGDVDGGGRVGVVAIKGFKNRRGVGWFRRGDMSLTSMAFTITGDRRSGLLIRG